MNHQTHPSGSAQNPPRPATPSSGHHRAGLDSGLAVFRIGLSPPGWHRRRGGMPLFPHHQPRYSVGMPSCPRNRSLPNQHPHPFVRSLPPSFPSLWPCAAASTSAGWDRLRAAATRRFPQTGLIVKARSGRIPHSSICRPELPRMRPIAGLSQGRRGKQPWSAKCSHVCRNNRVPPHIRSGAGFSRNLPLPGWPA